MYFDYRQTLIWAARALQAITGRGDLRGVDVAILPCVTSLAAVYPLAAAAGVHIGAQDIAADVSGAYTGEVSGQTLFQVGCRFAEVGHAERRRYFGEDNPLIARKLAQCLRSGMTPILCVGEPDQGTPAQAGAYCAAQLEQALELAGGELARRPLVIAYEPVWAIGQAEPASPDRIIDVCRSLRTWCDRHAAGRPVRIIYGGSAKGGLLAELDGSVDGLFLGRFAHDLSSFAAILDEIVELSEKRESWERLDGV